MRPAVTETRLYSYLVTRYTGRTVRHEIEAGLEAFDRHVLTVLDLRHVLLIDFSCADEVVAKLVLRGCEGPPRTARRCYFLFRGVADHHLDPIECALHRQKLAVAAEGADGEPLLLGTIDPVAARAWYEIWTLGRAASPILVDRLGLGPDRVATALRELDARGLVIRDEDGFVSFRHALRSRDSFEPPA